MILNKSNKRIKAIRKITAGVALSAMLAGGLFCISADKLMTDTPMSTVYAAGAYKPLNVEVSFKCLGNEKLSDGSYTISISATEDDYPLPEKQSSVVTNGEGSFSITFTEPGDYTYYVRQEKGSDKDIIYDDTEYEIHINVINKNWESEDSQPASDGKEELSFYMSVNYKGTDKKPAVIMFENKPEKDDSTEETSRKTTEDSEDKSEKTTEGTEDKTEKTTEGTTEKESEIIIKTEDTTVDKGETVVDNISTEDSKNAKTGDNTNIILTLILMLGSLVAVIILLLTKRYVGKRRENGEDE